MTYPCTGTGSAVSDSGGGGGRKRPRLGREIEPIWQHIPWRLVGPMLGCALDRGMGDEIMIRRAMLLLICVWASAAGAAQPQGVGATSGKPWQHTASGFTFPAAIADFVRDDIQDISEGKRIDIVGTYRHPASGTLATVYLYRPAMPMASLWFDIANWYIQRNPAFAPATAHRGATTFNVAGQSESADLRQVYAIGKAGRSSGVAIVPLGRWIVKVRMTSQGLEPGALDAALEAVVKGLGWPRTMPTAQASQPVPVCAGTLPQTNAEEIKQARSLVLIGAMLPLTSDESKDKREQPLPRLCRDDSRSDDAYPIYQLDEGTDGYVAAIGDNGTLLVVRNDPLTALAAKEIEGGKAGRAYYRVTVMTPTSWDQFPAFSRLPPVEQAFNIVRTRAPSSVTDIDTRTVNLSENSLK